MSFEMSLPHPPRIQSVAVDGTEVVAHDEKQWQLYYSVQAALKKDKEESLEGEAAAAAASGNEAGKPALESSKPAAAAVQASDPGKVLEKLMAARGELDVIVDLITFVEQQQFLAVEGVHRHPASLQERLRARCLRLAANKRQLAGAGERLAAGLTALRAQALVDNRLLEDLTQLRRRWKLQRHAGAAALFYADIELPLRGAAAAGVTQEGAHCNIIQDTNGDACVVESLPGGQRRVVRGWRHIHAVLEAKQRVLAWRVLQQLVAAQARLPQHEADSDRAVAAVQRMLAVAAAAAQAALARAVTGGGSGGGASGGSEAEGVAGMDVDGTGGSGSGHRQQMEEQEMGDVGGSVGAAAAELAGGGALPACLLSSAALDIQSALPLPGLQQEFERRALLQLARLLAGGSSSASARGVSSVGAASGGLQQGVLDSLMQWLHHAALCRRVSASLQRWSTHAAAGAGRSYRCVDSGEEFAAVWKLEGAASAGGSVTHPPRVLLIVQGGKVRLEGGGGGNLAALPPAAAAAAVRGLSGTDLDRILSLL